MFKPYKTDAGKRIQHPEDYWMLIKEEGQILWYLSKSKAFEKKLMINYKRGISKRLPHQPEEELQFDIEKLWEEKFGKYTKKYGVHRDKGRIRLPKKHNYYISKL